MGMLELVVTPRILFKSRQVTATLGGLSPTLTGYVLNPKA